MNDQALINLCSTIKKENCRRTEILRLSHIKIGSKEAVELTKIGQLVSIAISALVEMAANTMCGLAAKAAVYELWSDDNLAASIVKGVLTLCREPVLEVA